MKTSFLPALLIFAAACGKSTRHEQKSAGLLYERTPEMGVVETVYQVLDEKDRKRVGFVNKTSYDSGRLVYWVYGAEYKEKLGYLLPNNRAVKYVWYAGNRNRAEQDLPADTINANVRRVLDYGRPVVLEAIDQAELTKELLPGRYGKPAEEEGGPAQDEGGDEGTDAE